MENKINVETVLFAVKQAGELFLKNYKKNNIPKDKTELFTQLALIDERCIEVLKNNLKADFPDTPWNIGDEFESAGQIKPLDLREYWLCDAMDGAVQYLQHLPGWTINLVLIKNGKTHLSVIYDPLAQEIFWALENGGAFMNGKPIKPSLKTDNGMMIAVFEHGYDSSLTPELNQQRGTAVTHLLNEFGIVRNYGPHGLQLAYIGAGRIDVFHELGLDTYNWLAGILIAKEAGAEIFNSKGQPWKWGDKSLLVATPGVIEKFISKTNSNNR